MTTLTASPKLTIELVPTTSWFANLRDVLTQGEWDRVRTSVYRKAHYRCECCGGVGPKHPVEGHEVFEYDEDTGMQTLTGVVALCPACHSVKHLGMAMKLGKLERAMTHLMKVNGWSAQQAEDYAVAAFEQHHKRSERQWVVDLSWVEETYGIKPVRRKHVRAANTNHEKRTA